MASILRFDEWQDSNGTPILDGTGLAIPSSALPTGSILQVVSATKSDTFTTASNSFVDITGLSVSLTPRSISSKFLVSFFVHTIGDGNVIGSMVQIVRNSTAIGIGDAAGSRGRTTSGVYFGNDTSNNNTYVPVGNEFLDSPSTTSSITYKVQIRTTGNPTFVNRSSLDTDSSGFPRSISTITVMEVAG